VLTEAPPGGAALPAASFPVEPGEGLASVAARLEEQGLIVSARRFEWLARILRVDRGVKAGTYRLAHGADPRALLDDLVQGRVRALRLTIPEGVRLDRIADEVERTLSIPRDAFLAAAADSARLARYDGAPSLEGYLYPDTYFFVDGVDADTVVERMLDRFEAVWSSLTGAPPAGWGRHEVVTLASIVVAETSLAEEKPRVAAVYLNRLRDGWRLQADPTVRYGLGRFGGRLYFKHLDIDTPYNTYMHRGLPPGPIAAPGREALQAVLSPLEPCEDFFFVASGNGGHIFSRNKAEHDRARRAVREARQAPVEAKSP
ncbi:endolytic transglycosylase MltG, partial [bacterium]|nr:endolytic transglycosylase MltG [bacterium]